MMTGESDGAVTLKRMLYNMRVTHLSVGVTPTGSKLTNLTVV